MTAAATAANAGIPLARKAADAAMRAAGILLVTPDGRALFLRRSGQGDHPGEWSIPGGGVEPHEIPVQAAMRELKEETGIVINDPGSLKMVGHTATPDVDYTTFMVQVPKALEPRLNGEHNGHAWVPLEAPPKPTHPGLVSTIKGMGQDGREDRGNTVRDTIRYPPDDNEDGERAIDESFARGEDAAFDEEHEVLAASDADWEEGKHPRGQPGNAGQFTSGGGGGGNAGTEKTAKAKAEKKSGGQAAKIQALEDFLRDKLSPEHFVELQQILHGKGKSKKQPPKAEISGPAKEISYLLLTRRKLKVPEAAASLGSELTKKGYQAEFKGEPTKEDLAAWINELSEQIPKDTLMSAALNVSATTREVKSEKTPIGSNKGVKPKKPMAEKEAKPKPAVSSSQSYIDGLYKNYADPAKFDELLAKLKADKSISLETMKQISAGMGHPNTREKTRKGMIDEIAKWNMLNVRAARRESNMEPDEAKRKAEFDDTIRKTLAWMKENASKGAEKELSKRAKAKDELVRGCLELEARRRPRSVEGFVLRHGRAFMTGDETGTLEAPIEVADNPKKSEAGKHWGYHLILDISGCNEGIDDETTVRAFFKDLLAITKMKPIGDLIVVRVDNPEEGRGLTAVQIITTSTITFHGDDDQWCLYFDLFSCAAFDPRAVIDLVKKYFQPERIGKIWLYRDAGKWPTG
jgi:8-oxo-dGTP pyrophosphatase MutT (NUDIX family)/S-adenosylmethionine/arginine decarboxylase-like enzyme